MNTGRPTGRIRSVVVTALIAAVLIVCRLPATAQGNDLAGLWVGTATVNGVSQVNRATPDLSFDLGLTGVKDTETLVKAKSDAWGYNKTDTLSDATWSIGADSPTNWMNPRPAPFYAYQTGSAIAENQQVTTYFRKTFQAGDTSTYERLTLRVWVSGGVAVYLNGTGVVQENLSGLEYDSPALSETNGVRLYVIELPPTSLYGNQNNTLAAAVHSTGKSSSEIFFDLQLSARATTVTDHTLVPIHSPGWAHFDSGAAPDPAWATTDFDDASWAATGPAPFFQYKKGTAMAGSRKTAYFRKSFQVADPSLYNGLRLRVRHDDGIVVYLNGVEVYRDNMPYGPVTADTNALQDLLENRPVGTGLSAAAFNAGENWIAAEVHASGDNDNDLYFDLELTASVEAVLISPGAYRWKYTPTTNTPEPYAAPQPDYLDRKWAAVDYNDFNWAEARAELGFGDGGEETALGYNTALWPRTFYFRRTFTPGASGFDHLVIQLLRDDGAVVYINGIEIMRSNLPAGIIGYTTSPVTAVGPSLEGAYVVEEVHLDQHGPLLQPGENVIAVEVHQHPSELGDPNEPQTAVTPTPAAFSLRLLLHSNDGSTVNLLKEVYQMYRRENSNRVPVLLPSDLLIPNFEGPGWRLSTVGLDFDGATVGCAGAIASTGQVTCIVALPENHTTSPFLHRYHPDHDNWDARYEKKHPQDPGAPEEAFEVKRTITFTFEQKYPPGCVGTACRQFPPPGWGQSSIGGSYTEVFEGLHRDDITVTGSFSLDRVSTIGRLEQ